MLNQTIESDIYDKNGNLLLAKGQKMTKAVIKKLKRFGYHAPEETGTCDIDQSVEISTITQALREKINIRSDKIIETPNKILSTIIFESKTMPWWVYVNALINYVDWIYTHSIDVAIISLMMAIELGYNDKELYDIGLGAFMHDVGKLVIPKSIIQKIEPLTDMELVFIRQHCELGMTSLKPFGLTEECTNIILQHHERLDGSGYPKGIKEGEICLNAKIAMVADAFDAITSGRPYRNARGVDEAIMILKNEGLKYSQELITLLERILE